MSINGHSAAAPPLHIAFFGSSLLSAYWNGAATYYRGVIKALHQRGHRVTFYEPDAYDRQQHRDIDEPSWARVVVYDPAERETARQVKAAAATSDVLIKTSGVGVNDALLEQAVLDAGSLMTVFWDVDAPATLAAIDSGDPFGELAPHYDLILTYGGGRPVIDRYRALGARRCVPIYNALDPDTHYPEVRDGRFACDLAFLGNRLPDRESRVEEFFLRAAELAPQRCFVIGGSGWDGRPMPPNVRSVGHVYTVDHNAFNCSPLAVLNICRQSMAEVGYSPATRVFEAAGAGACIITDRWTGVEDFFAPDREILVADDGPGVVNLLDNLDEERAREIGRSARARALSDHTYSRRAALVEAELLAPSPRRSTAPLPARL